MGLAIRNAHGRPRHRRGGHAHPAHARHDANQQRRGGSDQPGRPGGAGVAVGEAPGTSAADPRGGTHPGPGPPRPTPAAAAHRRGGCPRDGGRRGRAGVPPATVSSHGSLSRRRRSYKRRSVSRATSRRRTNCRCRKRNCATGSTPADTLSSMLALSSPLVGFVMHSPSWVRCTAAGKVRSGPRRERALAH